MINNTCKKIALEKRQERMEKVFQTQDNNGRGTEEYRREKKWIVTVFYHEREECEVEKMWIRR